MGTFDSAGFAFVDVASTRFPDEKSQSGEVEINEIDHRELEDKGSEGLQDRSISELSLNVATYSSEVKYNKIGASARRVPGRICRHNNRAAITIPSISQATSMAPPTRSYGPHPSVNKKGALIPAGASVRKEQFILKKRTKQKDTKLEVEPKPMHNFFRNLLRPTEDIIKPGLALASKALGLIHDDSGLTSLDVPRGVRSKGNVKR